MHGAWGECLDSGVVGRVTVITEITEIMWCVCLAVSVGLAGRFVEAERPITRAIGRWISLG
jgi:hypothetical protein